MTEPLTSVELKHGIVVDFFDRSNRYFGDFYRVKIDVVARLPISDVQLPDELLTIAQGCAGVAIYEHSLEQMGVTTAERAAVTQALIDNFIATVGSYLEKDNFVESLLRRQLKRRREPLKEVY